MVNFTETGNHWCYKLLLCHIPGLVSISPRQVASFLVAIMISEHVSIAFWDQSKISGGWKARNQLWTHSMLMAAKQGLWECVGDF